MAPSRVDNEKNVIVGAVVREAAARPTHERPPATPASPAPLIARWPLPFAPSGERWQRSPVSALPAPPRACCCTTHDNQTAVSLGRRLPPGSAHRFHRGRRYSVCRKYTSLTITAAWHRPDHLLRNLVLFPQALQLLLMFDLTLTNDLLPQRLFLACTPSTPQTSHSATTPTVSCLLNARQGRTTECVGSTATAGATVPSQPTTHLWTACG